MAFPSRAEEWKDVPGYEGRYQVSNRGRVRSRPRWVRTVGGDGIPTQRLCPGKVLSPRGPRPFVELWIGNTSVKERVCRLVLLAFVGPCPKGMEACHFPDHDTRNNRLENLRWDTRKANSRDREAHGTMIRGESHYHATLTEEMVREARKLRALGWTYRLLGERYGCGTPAIYKAVQGITWSHIP